MGIQNLLPFLSKYARKMSLNDLRGKVCGIDVFGWLYKGAYIRVRMNWILARLQQSMSNTLYYV